MPAAVGVIQTLGFPAVLAAADAMVKAARVTLVHYDLAERAEFMVVIRGPVSEVETAMAAGIAAGENTPGGVVVTHYIIANPTDNVVDVMSIAYTDAVEQWR
ncbi:BMC domain-containing protein [Oscillatoria acuminata]|uniref:Carboxysome shell protein CcmK n=1 Tax=Oscillatoria acuminata PCC 6304 TaxID=56110 RepID=K9TPM4_9CYAN|nr:BMC domain-containing protein [Oscillatoria acuminata]AFY84772.1 carbon dioxide concentrating mechanism/carboxysome shell protein [Oscillatoria acuminata PCC 6304]